MQSMFDALADIETRFGRNVPSAVLIGLHGVLESIALAKRLGFSVADDAQLIRAVTAFQLGIGPDPRSSNADVRTSLLVTALVRRSGGVVKPDQNELAQSLMEQLFVAVFGAPWSEFETNHKA